MSVSLESRSRLSGSRSAVSTKSSSSDPSDSYGTISASYQTESTLEMSDEVEPRRS